MNGNDNPAVLSDRQLIRTLSRTLCQPHTGGARIRRGCYVTLPPRPLPAAGHEGEEDSGAITLSDWNELMGWCMAQPSAEAAFVVDGHGFLIASTEDEAGALEGLGAELCYSMEQLQRINAGEQPLLSVSLKFMGRAFFAVRVRSGQSDDIFVVGVVSKEALPRRSQRALMTLVEQNLANLL